MLKRLGNQAKTTLVLVTAFCLGMWVALRLTQLTSSKKPISMMHTKSERTEIIKMLIVSQLIASFSLIASHHGNYDCYITTQVMTIVITFQVDYKLNKQICEITTIYEIEKPFSAFHVTDPFPHESSHRNSLLRKLVYCNNFDFSFGEIQNHISFTTICLVYFIVLMYSGLS